MENNIEKQPLSVKEKTAVVNALMTQDRMEIRWVQDAILRITYMVIAGLFVVATYAGQQNTSLSKAHLHAGICVLMIVYWFSFRELNKWLEDSRACLRIREEFYADNQKLLFDPDFNPIRPIEEKDRSLALKDAAILYPFRITVAFAIFLMLYLIVSGIFELLSK